MWYFLPTTEVLLPIYFTPNTVKNTMKTIQFHTEMKGTGTTKIEVVMEELIMAVAMAKAKNTKVNFY